MSSSSTSSEVKVSSSSFSSPGVLPGVSLGVLVTASPPGVWIGPSDESNSSLN